MLISLSNNKILVNKTIGGAQKAPMSSCFMVYNLIQCKEQICTLGTKCHDKDSERCDEIWKYFL